MKRIMSAMLTVLHVVLMLAACAICAVCGADHLFELGQSERVLEWMSFLNNSDQLWNMAFVFLTASLVAYFLRITFFESGAKKKAQEELSTENMAAENCSEDIDYAGEVCYNINEADRVTIPVELILSELKGRKEMANRFILNETSYHGAGAISAIADEVKARGFVKAFVCSDPDLIKFGLTQKVTDILDGIDFPYEIYSNIKANPTVENVQGGVEAFKTSGADCIIAIGGGSSMDTAKAIGIIITNPEFADVVSLEGVAPTKNKCVPIIAVPTTAGTAAEVTINYVITDAANNRKMVCVDVHDIPVVAVVDPDMMSTMPKGLTAATGMDALTHAIEGYITKGAWEMSDMFHIKAIEIIAKNLRGAVENTAEGREGMALGQYIAGMGFSNVGLGIVHSMAHPLGALYDTPHGVANAIILPTVMEYNAPETGEKYRDIAKAMGVEGVDAMTLEDARKAAIDAVKQLSADVGIPADLKEIVKPEDVDFLSQSAYDDACRPGNPRETSVEEIKELYLSLM